MASEINSNGDIPFTYGFPSGDLNYSDCQSYLSSLEKDVNSHHLDGFSRFSKLGSSINPFTRLSASACEDFKQLEPSSEDFYYPAPPCDDLFSSQPNLDIPNEIIPLINNDEFMDNFINVGISSQFHSMPIDDHQSNIRQSDDHTQVEPFTVAPQNLPIEKCRMSQKKRKRVQPAEPATTVNEQIIKGKWSKDEDRILQELVTEYGDKQWAIIAGKMEGRVGKQCRERWIYHLNPNVKKSEWSVDEDETIVEGHKKVGSKWAEIAKLMPGRTDNAVKNRWNATLRKYNNSNSSLKSPSGSSSKSGPLWDYIAQLSKTSELKYATDDVDA